MQHALVLYKQWGAAGKITQLKQHFEPKTAHTPYPQRNNGKGLSAESSTSFSNSTTTIDLQSVVKLTNAITEEIELDQLLDRVMQVLLENAGAQVGWLVLDIQGELQLMARGNGSSHGFALPCPLDQNSWVCEKMIREVFASGEAVVLFDSQTDQHWQHNPYLKNGHTRSVLCQPLIKQGKVSGVVYLENNLLPGCFSPDRVELIHTISSQLAFSLENALLYQNLRSAAKQLEEQNSLLEQRVEERTAELKKSNDTKDQFFTIISHDLKGPLGSISELFEGVIQPNEPVDPELLKVIRQSTKNTYNLLTNLLTWASSQKGDLEIHPEDFAVAPVLLETMDVLRPVAEAKQITFDYQPEVPYFIHADVPMTTTIFRNLLNNAIKFSPKGGIIQIEVQAEGDQIQVTVADNGIGMNQKQIDKILLIGQKSTSQPGTAGERGTGLGLLLCKEFIELNQGEIGVESKKGEGSQFWFRLPPGTEGSSLGSNLTVDLETILKGLPTLLAEDDVVQMKTSSNTLRQLGVSVEIAMDGTEALAMCLSQEFKLILMDIDMPTMNGIEAARLMKANCKTMPLTIALTSYSQAELEENYGQMNFNGFLSKPLDPHELKLLIQQNIHKLQPSSDH